MKMLQWTEFHGKEKAISCKTFDERIFSLHLICSIALFPNKASNFFLKISNIHLTFKHKSLHADENKTIQIKTSYDRHFQLKLLCNRT